MFDNRKTETLPGLCIRGRTRKSIMVALRFKDEEAALVEVFEDGHARLAKHPGHFVPFWNYVKEGYPVTALQKLRLRSLYGKGAFLMGATNGRA